MSNNRFEFDGMEEFRAWLRDLPEHLRDDGAVLVESRGDEAFDTIHAKYTAHKHSGNLANHLRQEVESSKFGVSVLIRSTAKHGAIFENGTQIRKTKSGANRGAMPAANIFIPTMQSKRRLLFEDLINLLRSNDLEVSVG